MSQRGDIPSPPASPMPARRWPTILTGAMPWKNRYIGIPVLTGILSLLFKAGINDANCGLRALSRGCFERLGLKGAGMEFASEMIIRAALDLPDALEIEAAHVPEHGQQGGTKANEKEGKAVCING